MKHVRFYIVLFTCLMTASCVNNSVNSLANNYSAPSAYTIKQGGIASSILQASRPVIQDPVILDYLYSIKARLLKPINNPILTGNIYLLDDEYEYAFALSNGDIFLSTSFIKLAQEESELASVLAHELGHMLLGHFSTIEDYRNGKTAPKNLTRLNNSFDNVIEHGRSREQELEADKVMLKLQEAANYGNCGTYRMFTKLFSLTFKTDPNSRTTQLFDTHPAFPERLTQIEKYAGKECKGEELVASDIYQSKILNRL